MLTLIAVFVGHLTAGVSALVDGTASFIVWALWYNVMFIRGLCNLVLFGLKMCLELLTDIISACHYGIRDFASFIYDVLNICSAIVAAVNVGAEQLWSAGVQLLSNVVRLISTVCQAFLTSFDFLINIIGISCEKLVGLISLIGRSIKLLVFLLPVTFVKFFQLLFKFYRLFSDWAVTVLIWTFRLTVDVGRKSFAVATSQSFDVYLGILTAVLLYYAFKRRTVLKRYLLRLNPLLKIFCRQVRSVTPNFTSILPQIPLRPGNAPNTPMAARNRVLVNRRDVVTDQDSESDDEEDEEAETPGTPSPSTPRRDKTSKRVGSSSVTELAEELERLRDNQLCIICQDADRCIILLPCRHLCLCQPCVRRMFQHQVRCPICRSVVHDSLQVYS